MNQGYGARVLQWLQGKMSAVVYHGFGVFFLGWAWGYAAIWLLRAGSLLKRADRIVVMPEGGFGHTVSGPDAMRRLFPGQSLVFVVLEGSNHNPLVRLLWPDVSVVFLPCGWKLQWHGRIREWSASLATRRRLGRWLVRWLAWWTSAEVFSSVRELYRRVSKQHPVDAAADKWACHWEAGWFALIGQGRVPRARLPQQVRVAIQERIRRYAGTARRLCCVYLRGKGQGSLDSTNARRDGAPVAAYVPAIRTLLDHGYVVLVTGDRALPPGAKETLGRRLVCAQWLELDERLFSLFAGTESEVWIGNVGGGAMLPFACGIPMLVVDAFPYGAGLPGWMHYKTVRDHEGRLIHYSELFGRHGFDCELPGWVVCDNSADEIVAAVQEFLGGLTEPCSQAAQDVLAALPDHVMEKHLKGRFCEAWLRLFEDSGNQRAGAGPVRGGDQVIAGMGSTDATV